MLSSYSIINVIQLTGRVLVFQHCIVFLFDSTIMSSLLIRLMIMSRVHLVGTPTIDYSGNVSNYFTNSIYIALGCTVTQLFISFVFSGPNVPQNLVVNSQTVATLTVSWDTPFSGLVTEYKIRLLDVSWTEQTISGRATRKVIFTGLTAGAEYAVVLVAVSGDQQSETVEGHFYTGKYND